jgi:hypothetical protein
MSAEPTKGDDMDDGVGGDEKPSFFAGRGDQLEEIALDVGLVILFVVVIRNVRTLPDIAQWFPEFTVYTGFLIVGVKLIGDLLALRRPPKVTDKSSRFL